MAKNIFTGFLEGLAKDRYTPRTVLQLLARFGSVPIREAVAHHREMFPDLAAMLANDPNESVRASIAGNLCPQEETLQALSNDPSSLVRASVAGNFFTPKDTLLKLSKDSEKEVRLGVATNLATSADLLASLSQDQDSEVRAAAQERAEGLSRLEGLERIYKETGIWLSEREDGRLHYRGDLDLSHTSIRELPNGLSVEGALSLMGCPISSLPSDLKVGNLNVRDTPIATLPEDLDVKGSLYLSGTSIERLPKGLHVGGTLDLSDTPIKQLPEDLRVAQSLFLNNCTELIDLPLGLEVGGSLYLEGSGVRSLPRGLVVREAVDLGGTDVRELSEGMKIGYLNLEYSKVEALPKGLSVRTLYLDKSQITELPKDLEVKSTLYLDPHTSIEIPKEAKISSTFLSRQEDQHQGSGLNANSKDTIQFDEAKAVTEEVVGKIDLYWGRMGLAGSVEYTTHESYLKAIERELDCNPDGFRHQTLTSDPSVHKAVDDLIHGAFGEDNPHDLNWYEDQLARSSEIKQKEDQEPDIQVKAQAGAELDEIKVISEEVVGVVEGVAYTDKEDYLEAIDAEMTYSPYYSSSGGPEFTYQTLTSDPSVHKAVDDLIHGAFGEDNPHDLNWYKDHQTLQSSLADSTAKDEVRLLNHTFTPEERERLMAGEVITLTDLKTKDGRSIPPVHLSRNPETGKLTRVNTPQQEKSVSRQPKQVVSAPRPSRRI